MEENNSIVQNPSTNDDQNTSTTSTVPVNNKPLFEIKKTDNIFTVCALVTGIFTSLFGIFGGFALGYLISMIMFIVTISVYLVKINDIHAFPVICIALALCNSAIFITTTNSSVKFFGVIISFALSIAGSTGLVLGKTKGNRATVNVFKNAFSTVGNIGISVKSLLSGNDGRKKSVGKAMVGLLCAVPVLIVVVPLLIKSDDAFSGMMSRIFDGSGNTLTIILKVVFGVLLSLMVISYGLSLKAKRILNTKESKNRNVNNVSIISFLSAIATCYLLYLFSQLAYFFSAFKGFLPNEDTTYAQYARKGFFEMCIIAVINLGIVFLSILIAKKENGKICIGIKIMTTFISTFTLIIISTAISKMVLYINEYGMTVLRITTSAFMLFLAIVFLSLVLKIYINNINIVKTSLVTAGIIVLLLGTLNVNSVCAKYNYDAYKEKRLDSIDVKAMYDLGDEGIPYVVMIACSKDSDVATQAQKYLAEAYLYDYFDDMEYAKDFTIDDLKEKQKDKGFAQFSIPKANAYEKLYKFIEKNPQFASKCHTYFDDIDNNYFW